MNLSVKLTQKEDFDRTASVVNHQIFTKKHTFSETKRTGIFASDIL